MWCHSCHHLESLSFTFIRGGGEERTGEGGGGREVEETGLRQRETHIFLAITAFSIQKQLHNDIAKAVYGMSRFGDIVSV